jgi:hypothetical protein
MSKQNIVPGTIILLISLALGGTYFFFHSNFVFLVLSIFGVLIVVSIITRPIKQLKIVQYFDLSFGWILASIYLVATFAISIGLVFFSIYLTWVLLTIGFKSIMWIFGYAETVRMNWADDNKVLLYCSTLATVILASYQGNNLIILVNKLFRISSNNKNPVEITEKFALLFVKYADFRRRCYEISIALYIFSVIEKLFNKNLLSLPLWLTYKTVALEVLLSFIAIDSYVRNYPIKRKKE